MAALGYRPGAEERCDSSGSFPHWTLPLGWLFIAMGSVGERALSLVWWGVLLGAFTMGVFSSERTERGVLGPRFGNTGNRCGLSCTLECRLLEPVSFGHSANLSDGLFGGSFWRLNIFMTWSRLVCVGNCWTVWPDYGRHLCGGCGFPFFSFGMTLAALPGESGELDG